jgi:hypothetical protein
MPHENGTFLVIQDGEPMFSSGVKTFDDLLEETDYTINAINITFNNCKSVSTTEIGFSNIKLPGQSDQPMPGHVIMSTPDGPRWRKP